MGSAGISSDDAVDSLIRAHVKKLQENSHGEQSDLPFFVADTSKLAIQHSRWKRLLPEIQPFYAVKCNSDQRLLQTLAKLGANFDCASLEEIRAVLSLGVDPSRIVFAHPCKPISALHFAFERGVRLTTFDNIDELDKIKRHCPEMDLLLRIFATDGGAKVCLSKKYGARREAITALLHRAKILALKITGVSFHIGSGASDPQAFTGAVKQARHIFDQGERMGFHMSVLDIGGGFQDHDFECMAAGLREALAREFPHSLPRLIAEPGRFYATPFYTMVCRITSRRTQAGPGSVDMLYQNDGLYGCFSCKWSEASVFTPILIQPPLGKKALPRVEGEHRYSLWGPTCDSVDLVAEEMVFNCEVRPGDWLKYQDMGAYTTSAASQFNGFPNTYTVIYREDMK